MAKVAKLVSISLMTRVVVEDTATEEEILTLTRPRFIEKIRTDLEDNIISIENDTECPYDPETDQSPGESNEL